MAGDYLFQMILAINAISHHWGLKREGRPGARVSDIWELHISSVFQKRVPSSRVTPTTIYQYAFMTRLCALKRQTLSSVCGRMCTRQSWLIHSLSGTKGRFLRNLSNFLFLRSSKDAHVRLNFSASRRHRRSVDEHRVVAFS